VNDAMALDAPRKQRHAITRIFHRLVEEHGADVSCQMVRSYVSDRKPEILARRLSRTSRP
jgi:pyocin large subunit-like protein